MTFEFMPEGECGGKLPANNDTQAPIATSTANFPEPNEEDRLLQQQANELRELRLALAGWNDAYAAFLGAFDTPVARRMNGDEYAQDARARLRDLNIRLKAIGAA